MPRTFAALPSAIALVATLWLPSARAQLSEPGSVLIYPEFDSRAGRTTVLTITNTEAASGGSVRVHFVFLNAADCAEFDRSELLTPNDTFSAVAASYVPGVTRGWFYAFAQHPSNGRPISRNRLIGVTSILDGVAATNYSLAAVSFLSPLAPESPTDLDSDGTRDLDGQEYAAFAEEVLIPRFVGQSTAYREELILIPLTGGREFTSQARFLVYNDNESIFSASYNVNCWARVPLSSISSVFSNSFLASSPDDPDEHLSGNETGWFVVDGGSATSGGVSLPDPAILAVLISPERGGGPTLPFGRGTQTNADLSPTANFGD